MSLARARARLAGAVSGEVRSAEPMSRHTTFRIGGPAALYVVTDSLSDVSNATGILREEEVPYTVAGKGSNLLVADDGYEGAVLVLGRDFKHHAIGDGMLRAGAGTILAFLVQQAFHEGVAGMTWGVGIPGTLGGALAMNAGTREGWIGQIVESVTLFVPGQGLSLVKGSDVEWGYRTSGLAGRGIIVEGVLRVTEGDPVRIRTEMERNLKARKASQPLGLPSAGSVFINPVGDSAGRLIEAAGCKGMRLGGAAVSTVHANFIVNEGDATAADVAGLIRKIRMTVRDTHGVELKPEIRFLGTF
jgi:UDP-N-acetylmuramate dehydrogenase